MKRSLATRFLSDYGMVLVLLGLCFYYSLATLELQYPSGEAAGHDLARHLARQIGPAGRVLIIAGANQEGAAFTAALQAGLAAAKVKVLDAVRGEPADARRALEKIASQGGGLEVIACTHAVAAWSLFNDLAAAFPALARARVAEPPSYRWPNFLKAENLLNVANQIAVIAIIAVGMTLVIVAGGIDLSVGSLTALSAVVATLLIRDAAGGEQATALGMLWSSLAGILVCTAVGLFSGLMITWFMIPAFIATLAMMLVASGLAFIIAQGQSIYQVPDAYVWLGRGAELGLPNAVVLMLVLYGLAHVLMAHTPLGRYIYAVGGNQEAARLSGVPVRRVVVLVYGVCGALAGLGGVVMASQLKSGAPTYGQMYELYVIAAAVVGGTSLAGGEGRVLGTLIGALIIAVIQNGMNLTGVESYTQKVVLGLVILSAVLLDMLKHRGWSKRLGGRGF